jgi:hypothetical protein
MCEVMYEQSSPQLLELIQRNWSVVVNHSNPIDLNGDDDVNVEEDNDDQDEDDIELMEEQDDPIETEDKRRAALNKLSTVKKYGICLLALQDLDLVGREMLGPDLKASRQKEREDQNKRIAQIHEAVAHFQTVAGIRREHLHARLANNENTPHECSWEIDYIDIIPKF